MLGLGGNNEGQEKSKTKFIQIANIKGTVVCICYAIDVVVCVSAKNIKKIITFGEQRKRNYWTSPNSENLKNKNKTGKYTRQSQSGIKCWNIKITFLT